MTTSRNITSHTNKKPFRIQGDLTCQSKSVVYALTCPACGKQYVGETGRTLATRISEHKRDILRRNKKSPAALHFLDHDVDPKELICTALDNSSKNRNKRLRLEEAYIRLMSTMNPDGVNNKM